MTPYANDADSEEFAGFTFENGTDRIAMYGQADLTRDQEGLARVRKLHDALGKVLVALETEKDLPPKVGDKPADQVDNPFG